MSPRPKSTARLHFATSLGKPKCERQLTAPRPWRLRRTQPLCAADIASGQWGC